MLGKYFLSSNHFLIKIFIILPFEPRFFSDENSFSNVPRLLHVHCLNTEFSYRSQHAIHHFTDNYKAVLWSDFSCVISIVRMMGTFFFERHTWLIFYWRQSSNGFPKYRAKKRRIKLNINYQPESTLNGCDISPYEPGIKRTVMFYAVCVL